LVNGFGGKLMRPDGDIAAGAQQETEIKAIMATATATPKETKKKIKFRPMDDRVLIEPSEADETTSGGIILPQTAREKPQRGTIIAVGPGKLLDSGKRGEMGVRVGDEVYYGKYAGTEIDFGADKYVVIRETDVLAVVDSK